MATPVGMWLGVSVALVVAVSPSANGSGALHAQNPTPVGHQATLPSPSADPLTKRIAIKLVDVPLPQALATISEQSHVRLTYSSDELPAGRRVSLSDAPISVGAALDVVLANTELHPVAMSDGGIVLTPKSASAAIQHNSTGDSSGTVAGILLGRDDGQPVQYGTVLLLETDIARFADAGGHFRLTRLAPGTYTLRARQIGYAPTNVTVQVGPAPAVSTVTIVMTRLPPLLALVTVKGRRSKECIATGIPDSTVDPRLAAIFAQVRENVDRLRLVEEGYPFRFTREERMVLRLDPGGDTTEWLDSVSYESRARRPYRVGGIIFVESGWRVLSETLPRKGTVPAGQESAEEVVHVVEHGVEHDVRKVARDSLGDSSYALMYSRRYMYLPTFRDLADSAFLSAHCFAYGGTRSLGRTGEHLIRIDFRPAASISSPDVEGSIYLDAQRYVVRRAVFEMTKPEAAEPPLLGLSVTTTFRELVPLIPVFDSVSAEQPLRDLFGTQGPVTRVLLEDDRILNFAFEAQSPGDQPSSPIESAEVPSTETRLIPTGQTMLVTTKERPVVTTPPAPSEPPFGYDTLGIAVKGRVIRPDGTPVQGAVVGVLGSTDSASTSDSGRFVLHNVTAGAHIMWARGVGFDRTRVAVTVSPDRARTVTITVAHRVPTLAAVVTTAKYPAGYINVGLDKRIEAGVGQFLTYDQIQDRHAARLSELLKGLRGIQVRQGAREFEATVQSTRPNGLSYVGCVSFAIDGVPQNQLNNHTATGSPLPPTDADILIAPSAIGAIESYSPSERPAGFEEGAQWCRLVMIWTRSRLGLTSDDSTNVQTQAPSNAVPQTIGTPLFPAGTASTCQRPSAIDTARLNVFAVLQSSVTSNAVDTGWFSYADRVLAAFRAAFVLPTSVQLPAFGYPYPAPPSAGAKSPGPLVAPSLSSVVVFTLGPTGAVLNSHIAASSLSGNADTSVLAAVEAAAAIHSFPVIQATASAPPSTRFDVLVTTTTPDSTQRAAVVGQIDVPVWRLARSAELLPGTYSADSPIRNPGAPHDSVAFELVVDEYGRAIMSTVRAISEAGSGKTDLEHRAVVKRLAHLLTDSRFDPALIGSCPVQQVITQPFAD